MRSGLKGHLSAGRLSRDLQTILRTNQALSLERNLDRLLDRITEAACELVGADRCTLFIVDHASGLLLSHLAQGSDTIRIPLGTGIAGAVAKSGEVVNIPDAYADGRFNPAQDRSSGYRTVSLLTVPMRGHDERMVGVIQALNKRPDRSGIRNALQADRYHQATQRFHRVVQEGRRPSVEIRRARLALAEAALAYGDRETCQQQLECLSQEGDLRPRELALLEALRGRLLLWVESDGSDPVPFTAYDEQILAALCGQAAVAIDNARLIQADLERQKLAHDLNLARRIQTSLLPASMPRISGWALAAWHEAAEQTSGDYHDVLSVGQGGLDLVVGDVSGHGTAAALLMSTARAFLRGIYAHQADASIATMLSQLNALLANDLSDDAFMSMCLARLYDDGRVNYVSAGHEAPLVFRRAVARFDNETDEGGTMLGVLDDQEFSEHHIAPLAQGDVLVMLTDGLHEALSPHTEAAWGLAGVRQTIAHTVLAGGGAEAVAQAVRAALRAHLDGRRSADDCTLVVAERCAC